MPPQNSVSPSQMDSRLLRLNPQCPSTYPSETAQEMALPLNLGEWGGGGRECSNSIHRNTTQQLLSSTLKVAFSRNELTCLPKLSKMFNRWTQGYSCRGLQEIWGLDWFHALWFLKHKDGKTSPPGCPCRSLRSMLPWSRPTYLLLPFIFYPVCIGASACANICVNHVQAMPVKARRGYCVPRV